MSQADASDFVVIDTCGEVGTVALVVGGVVASTETLPARTASAALLPALELLLEGAGIPLAKLDGVGVVSGPGSFTGVRVGMAAAKGLCEVTGLRLATVSRLEVLAAAAGFGGDADGMAMLDAGRGEVYAREAASGVERLMGLDAAVAWAGGRRLAVEPRLEQKLAAAGAAELRVAEPSAADAVELVAARLRAGGVDPVLADANYVRGEAEIYGRQKAIAGAAAEAAGERP